jgi:hypothetical protein
MPKHSTWVRCGLNVAYWPPFCEIWLEKWKAQILAGAPPKTAGQWVNTLRYNFLPTTHLTQSTESESAQYLETCLDMF